MSPLFKKTLLWLIVSAITGFTASQIMIYTFPYVIMEIANKRLFAEQGVNSIIHAPRVTHASRAVVRPSPDLVYSICGFDLSEGPLEVTVPQTNGNYWSASAYASNTDNFWVLNDQSLKKEETKIYLGTAIQLASLELNQDEESVISPSNTGVILFRNLVALPEEFSIVNQLRRKTKYKPVN
ncbi:MAG: DUF1254 domain-containing protein [Sneathiellales bacterium]|nr:DUF1254 domain-containing protein [Sneathiellales bacterium]